MGKPIPSVIIAYLNYSRQYPLTKQQTVILLKELENALGIENLSNMREIDEILLAIHKATPERMYQPDYQYYNIY